MLIKDFITRDFPVLKSSDTGEQALAIMEDFKVKHLPLLGDDRMYQSLVSEKAILGMTDLSQPVGQLIIFAPSVNEAGHWLQALELFSRYHLTLLPGVAAGGKYRGVITQETLVDVFALLTNADSSGSIIVLEVLPQDYMVSDIARIVEANNAHLLSLLTYRHPSTGRLMVIVKIDLEDASPVVRGFERFNYEVRYYYMEQGMVDDLLQRRMDELIHYLNI